MSRGLCLASFASRLCYLRTNHSSGSSTMATSNGSPSPEEKERLNVHEVYSQIAPHFSDTRFNPWPRVAQFIKDLPPGSIMADVGCGNGKYLGVNQFVYSLGSDICPELVEIPKGLGHQVMTCDCLSLPYRSDVFDAVISIAVIHHLSTDERREMAINEMARILRPGGLMLIYVWAMEQSKRKFTEQDVLVPWHLKPCYHGDINAAATGEKHKPKKNRKGRKKKQKSSTATLHSHDRQSSADTTNEQSLADTNTLYDGQSLADTNTLYDGQSLADTNTLYDGQSLADTNILCDEQPSANIINELPHDGISSLTDSLPSPAITSNSHDNDRSHMISDAHRQGFKTYYRYYHMFIEGELISLCSREPSLKIVSSWYDHENWCVLAEKL